MPFLDSLRLDRFLSFAPESEPIRLTALNVLIGPNGSGKSNLIEAIELLRAMPTGFAAAIRDGGGPREWIWKGDTAATASSTIEARLAGAPSPLPLRYQLSFTASGLRTEVTDELLEETAKRHPNESDVFFYYRFQQGRPTINVRGEPKRRALERQSLAPDESVLSQRKDPDLYPELTWVGQQFGKIQTFREWSFGRYAAVRQPQQADMPSDYLLPDSRNLALLLNQLELSDQKTEFDRLLGQFLPRFQRLTTSIQGVQLFLHEEGLKAPVPSTRLSDGTIRFMAMLALLLSPTPPPLICLEEPELGLHPDATRLLAELMVAASQRTQLVVTTHSDALVSDLTEQAESVLVAEHLGGTRIRRLEAAKLRFWLDRYRLGELWRMGELGGNP